MNLSKIRILPFYILGVVFFVSCSFSNRQNNNSSQFKNDNNMDTIEIFDIENFRKNAIGNTYEFVSDGISIAQHKRNGCYLEERIYSDNIFFQTDKTFNEKGILAIEGTRYRYSESFHIGIWKYYDQEGKLVREENYGNFDWNKILDIAEQYKIDLADQYTKLVRHIEISSPYWELSWVPFLGENGIKRTIIISAENYNITDESETPFFIME